MSLFNCVEEESSWTPPSDLPDLRDGFKAVDTETHDLGIQSQRLGAGWAFPADVGGHVIGVSVAHESGWSCYIPLAHERSENFDVDRVSRWLNESVFAGGVVAMHQSTYDLGWLRTIGVRPSANVRIEDTYCAAVLALYDQKGHGLDAVSKYFGRRGKSKRAMRDAAARFGISDRELMSRLKMLPASIVGPYGEDDAIETLEVLPSLIERVDQLDMRRIYEIERRIAQILVDVRLKGVKVDFDAAVTNRDNLRRAVKDAKANVAMRTGVQIEPWEAASIAKALDYLGVEYPRTGKTGAPSITETFLSTIDHDVVRMILNARNCDKTAQLIDGHILNHAIDGRIHCEFHPLFGDEGGARTGRFSSSNPNLQQIPSRKSTAALCRGMFIPEDDHKWWCFDYASQEPRMTVHFCELVQRIGHSRFAFRGAIDAGDQFRSNPAHDFHQWAAELFSKPRKQAKALFLGKVYGKGGASVCDELGLPVVTVKPPKWRDPVPDGTPGSVRIAGPEGKEIIARFDDALPFIKDFQRLSTEVAESRGYVKTILNRRVPVDKGFEYKGTNYMIQGSGADQMKAAIVACADADYVPSLTVHDELDFPDVEESDAPRIKEIMEHVLDDATAIPALVDVEVGDDWASLKAASL